MFPSKEESKPPLRVKPSILVNDKKIREDQMDREGVDDEEEDSTPGELIDCFPAICYKK